jgi:FMN phosphatase YigB (HAD superfamily)
LKGVDTFLFDLDGTLLPMDIEEFTQLYFQEMAKVFSDIIEPERLVKYVWKATKDMISNMEQRPNQEVFMESFANLVGQDKLQLYRDRFDAFYDEGFLNTRKCVGDVPFMRESVYILKDKGYRAAIATNPLFPRKAIIHRVKWAGFKPEDFSYISCYENNCFCKPQIAFYEEVLKNIGRQPHQCIMVGNDVQEDMVAASLGMKTFLITDYLIHRAKEPIECTYMGSYEEFYEFAKQLPAIDAYESY